jgi:glycosyltransferase involved in cell wall biosynthesis
LKISILPGGLDATLTSRILPLASAFKNLGAECNIMRPIDWGSLVNLKLANILSVVFTHSIEKYASILKGSQDVVIIGRASSPQIYIFEKILKRKKTKVVFDLDDALFLTNADFLGINMRPGSFALESIIKNADLVTVNGHYLFEFAYSLNKNTEIVHDPIDTRLFYPRRNKPRNRKLTLGWEGVPNNHYDNLAILVVPLTKLSKEYDLKFKLVSSLGDPKIKHMFKSLEETMEIDYGSKQWLPNAQFVESISDFDILLSPLQRTPWFEGKSALRAGIGMALGIPVVASPVGEQKYAIRQGTTGFLATNEDDWYSYLKKLITDDELRKVMGRNGKEIVENELSLNKVADKLRCTLETLVYSASS